LVTFAGKSVICIIDFLKVVYPGAGYPLQAKRDRGYPENNVGPPEFQVKAGN